MRKSRVIGSLLGAIVLSSVSVVAGPAAAAASCHKINAKGVGQDLGEGNTTANINGGGLLNGTTRGHFDVGGGTPPVLPISGTVEFTTNKATLTVGVNGSFNVASGDFDATGPVIASTGKLEGATGNLTLTGTENLATGRFTEKITGTICVDLAP